MDDRRGLEEAITRATGQTFRVAQLRPLGGGCINDAYQATDGSRSFFVKVNQPQFADAFSAEAEALQALAETRTIRIPQVVCQHTGDTEAFLVLEYVEFSRSAPPDWRELGLQLARLHAQPQPRFGWHRDNHIGATPQANAYSETWNDFFRQHRLARLFALCRSKGHVFRNSDALLEAIDAILADHAPYPSLLHGDLWSGNVAFDADGMPFVFDPATYCGDRETDLAFTEFFGGFAPAFYEAYRAELPLDPGYPRRRDLYNLYHCLNHAYLFGPSYAHQAQSMIDQMVNSQ